MKVLKPIGIILMYALAAPAFIGIIFGLTKEVLTLFLVFWTTLKYLFHF